MNLVIHSRKLSCKVHIPSSKSAAHRALICAAFSNAPTRVKLRGLSEDIRATIRCLSALGAGITEECDALLVSPVKNAPKDAVLDCGESGSTLRFLLPICAALGVHASFVCHGRLASRPMDDLVGALSEHGITFTGTHEIRGQLTGGTFRLRGNISSQYLTGLLFALSLLGETSEIRLSTKLESASYVTLTTSILAEFGAKITQEEPSAAFSALPPPRFTKSKVIIPPVPFGSERECAYADSKPTVCRATLPSSRCLCKWGQRSERKTAYSKPFDRTRKRSLQTPRTSPTSFRRSRCSVPL